MLFELLIYVCSVELGEVSCLAAKPYSEQVTSLVVCSARLSEQTLRLFEVPEWQELVIVQYSISCRPVNSAGLSGGKPGFYTTLP